VTVRAALVDGRVNPIPGDVALDEAAARVHEQAHEHCFIARSVNFPVRVEPLPVVVEAPAVDAGAAPAD
jgi:hypothetical protein